MRALGAPVVLDPGEADVVTAIRDLTGGHGADASVDAAGVPAAIRAGLHGTRIDGNFVVVAIHEKPIEIPPFDLLMPEVRLTGVALSCNDFPAVIDAMAVGTFPTDGWVSTIAFERLIEDGFERLHRQEALKLLVDLETARPGC
jgi:(R,R)-butanediol dehydrogenase/meso-butanediol dehydrogenase/diacetyl reductase